VDIRYEQPVGGPNGGPVTILDLLFCPHSSGDTESSVVSEAQLPSAEEVAGSLLSTLDTPSAVANASTAERFDSSLEREAELPRERVATRLVVATMRAYWSPWLGDARARQHARELESRAHGATEVPLISPVPPRSPEDV
jgi:hypothetical protein